MTDNERYQELKAELTELALNHQISGETAREMLALSRNYTPEQLIGAFLLNKPGRLTRLVVESPLAVYVDRMIEGALGE